MRGDANCDDAVNALDATTILWMIVGYQNWPCAGVTADTDCDAEITPNDALAILLHVRGLSEFAAQPCPGASPSPTATPSTSPSPTPTPSPG